MNSPSRAHGIALEVEDLQRIKASCFISLLGRHLNLKYDAIALAMVYLNAYFLRKSMPNPDPEAKGNTKKQRSNFFFVCGASALLASKVRSHVKVKVYRVVDVMCHFGPTKSPTPNPESQEALKLVDAVVQAECDLLTVLEFDLKISLPHDFIENFVDVIFGDENEKAKSLTHQLALNFSNDSCRLGICLFSSTRLVALACVRLAMKFLSMDDAKFHLPSGWLERSLSVFGAESFSLKELKDKLDLVCSRCVLSFKRSAPARKF